VCRKPVLSIATVARLAHLRKERVLEMARANRLPMIDYGEQEMVDAEAFERFAERELADDVAAAIRGARGEPIRVNVAPEPAGAQPTATRSYDAENIEVVLRAALKAHDGLLSLPLLYAWCESEGLPRLDIGTIRRRMGVATWTDALRVCGGRRGITTPERSKLALRTIRRALDAHGGRATLEQFRTWARETGAEWRCPQNAAAAAGYRRWLDACEAALALPAENNSPDDV
jgi:hypothetical protein